MNLKHRFEANKRACNVQRNICLPGEKSKKKEYFDNLDHEKITDD